MKSLEGNVPTLPVYDGQKTVLGYRSPGQKRRGNKTPGQEEETYRFDIAVQEPRSGACTEISWKQLIKDRELDQGGVEIIENDQSEFGDIIKKYGRKKNTKKVDDEDYYDLD